MPNFEKMIDSLNLPKQILDKGEQLLKTLFGASFEELGGMMADQVRLRRFRNQITIFSKAQQLLKDKHIDPKKVSLKVLAPLMEYSSYEEEESLQDKWAKLTAYILEDDTAISFQQNAIQILNRISTHEAKLLEDFYKEVNLSRLHLHERLVAQQEGLKKSAPHKRITAVTNPDEFPVRNFPFYAHMYALEHHINEKEFHSHISGLVALGLLKWETQVEVELIAADEPFINDALETHVHNSRQFTITSLGEHFIKVCQPDSASSIQS